MYSNELIKNPIFIKLKEEWEKKHNSKLEPVLTRIF